MSSTINKPEIQTALQELAADHPRSQFVLLRRNSEGRTTTHFLNIGMNTVDDMLLVAHDQIINMVKPPAILDTTDPEDEEDVRWE